jgi:hypothetical protein
MAFIEHRFARKGPVATLRIYHTDSWNSVKSSDTFTTPILLSTPDGINAHDFISGGFDVRRGLGLIGITVAECESIPFPKSYLYSANLDRDPEPEFFIHQSFTTNLREVPIKKGTYMVDYDHRKRKWMLKPYTGWGAFWRIGGWRIFLIEAILLVLFFIYIFKIKVTNQR